MPIKEHRLEYLPRVEGRADLSLWRASAPQRLIFGHQTKRPIFVRIGDETARNALENMGVEVSGNGWQPLLVDSGTLMNLMAAEGRLKLQSAPAHRPLLDRTVMEIGAGVVHQGQHEFFGQRGAGVLVGVVDTGIDLSHPSFWNEDGTSRVIAVWDQDGQSESVPDNFGYGDLCDEQMILDHECTLVDTIGHGTHVAGIAAGAAGVAPGSDIAVVRSDSFTRVADAVLYLRELASKRGQPLVVNLSVGGHYGPHDGRTPLEEYLEKVVGPGVILVAAAGNDGARNIHVGHDFEDEIKRVSLQGVPWSKPAEITLEFWSDSSTEISMGIELWSNDQRVQHITLDASDSEYLETSLEQNAQQLLDVTFGMSMGEHGMIKRTLLLEPTGVKALQANTDVVLTLRGTGRLDGWLNQSDYRYGLVTFKKTAESGWLSGDSERSITVPATGKALVTVGSYSVRNQWRSEDASEHSVGQAELGSISSFSSRGPVLVDGTSLTKPDITAPGSMIISARSMSVAPSMQTISENRMIMQGTSMAAPHVTGVVALMLEVNPSLTPDQVKDYLARAARADEFTGQLPNDSWGHGKIDAVGSVAIVEPGGFGCAALPVQTGVNHWIWLLVLAWLPRLKKRQR